MKTTFCIIGALFLLVSEGIYDSVYNWISWEKTGTVAIVLISFGWLILSRNAIRKGHGR